MNEDRGADAAPCLSVRELGVMAGGRSVLQGVSLDVARGEVVGVLGPNGSGKTTLLEVLAGLRPTCAGTIRVGHRELVSFSDRLSTVAFMPDDILLPEETALGTALGLRAHEPLVERFGLAPLLAARANEVSRGESKRAQLCATLKLARPLLLLDEPFAAFDPRQLRTLLPLFRDAARASAVVVTIHQMETAALVADRLLILAEGRALAFGSLDELRAMAGLPLGTLADVFLQLLDKRDCHVPA